MAEKKKGIGCAAGTGTVVGEPEEKQATETNDQIKKEKDMTAVKIGQKAPDFTAPAFMNGDFGQVKLADYLGKWVLICFYPGDYTFV